MGKSEVTPLVLLIDQIGAAREKAEAAKKLEEQLKPILEKYELKTGSYAGTTFNLTVSERIETNYSVEKVYKHLGVKGLLKVVKVVVKALKERVTLAELDNLVDGTPSAKSTYSFSRVGK